MYSRGTQYGVASIAYCTLLHQFWGIYLEFTHLVFAYTGTQSDLFSSQHQSPNYCFLYTGVPLPDTVYNASLETLEIAATMQNEVKAMHKCMLHI